MNPEKINQSKHQLIRSKNQTNEKAKEVDTTRCGKKRQQEGELSKDVEPLVTNRLKKTLQAIRTSKVRLDDHEKITQMLLERNSLKVDRSKTNEVSER